MPYSLEQIIGGLVVSAPGVWAVIKYYREARSVAIQSSNRQIKTRQDELGKKLGIEIDDRQKLTDQLFKLINNLEAEVEKCEQKRSKDLIRIEEMHNLILEKSAIISSMRNYLKQVAPEYFEDDVSDD